MNCATFGLAQSELPPDLLDAIYDDVVRVCPADRVFRMAADWLGAARLEWLERGIIDAHSAPETLFVPLRSTHDQVPRGLLAVHRGERHLAGAWHPDRIEAVAAHFATALAYREKLVASRSMYEAYASGLDRLAVGAMTVQESGQAVDANRAARHILDQRDGLSLIGGKLCAGQPAVQKALRRLIDAVCAGEIEQGGMHVQRPSGAPDLYLLVLRRPQRLGTVRAGVRILLRDPQAAQVQSRAALTELYGLTETEAAITLELANGCSPEAVEEKFGIRHNTTRAHLRAIYAKLGVGTHAELVYTVLTGAGGLALDDEAQLGALEPLTPLYR